MTEEEDRLRRIRIGDQAEQFIASEFGLALLDKAEEHRRHALNILKDVDAEDPKEIRKWQNEVRIAETFAPWLLELAEETKVFLMQIEEEKAESATF